MPYLTTRHYRLINLLAALLLLAAGLNGLVLDSPFLPAHKETFLYVAFAVTAATFFVKPTPEVGPLRVPPLSLVQMRIVAGVLLVICLLSLANYHLLEPGLFAPYKKQVSVVAFALMGLFFVLYSSRLAELSKKVSERGGGDA